MSQVDEGNVWLAPSTQSHLCFEGVGHICIHMDSFPSTWFGSRYTNKFLRRCACDSGRCRAICVEKRGEDKTMECVCVWICMLEIVAANRCLFSLAQIVRERNESTGNQLCCVQAEPRRRVALRFDCWENGIFVYLLALHKSYTYERFWRFRTAHSRNLLSLIKFGRTRWAWVHRRIHPKYRIGIAYTL